MTPEQRKRHIKQLLFLEDLGHIEEDPLAAYCPVSLTSTPQVIKPYIKERQRILMEEILTPAGITGYDPASAPFSPDKDLSGSPEEIYKIDYARVAGARFFVGHVLIPSTGQGIEIQIAKDLNKIPVFFIDKSIRVSRMQTNRAIYLQYSNFAKQANEFVQVFELLKKYEPGMGFNDHIPALLGFDNNYSVVDLEALVYDKFPQFKYEFDGTKPIVNLNVTNPEVFYEHQ